jgi:hypothetical protein
VISTGYCPAAKVRPMSNSIKEEREKMGYSQVKAAALASCALNTWRVFELAPNAVSPRKRAACEAALTVIRAKTG